MKTQNNQRREVRYIVRAAIIAAIYAVAAYFSAPLQFANFQFRLSEALCILPIFMPEAAVGLFLGAILANYITGCVLWDIVFGSIATLLGALGARMLSRLPDKLLWLSTLPTVISNAVIVPFVIIYAYGSADSYWFLFFTVAVGEIVTAGILGSALLYYLKRRKFKF